MSCRRRRLAALALFTVTGAGCGSAGPGDLPPAAEPARSPPLSGPPDGRVVRVGNGPEGVVADAVTGRVAVALRDPDELALLDGRRGTILRRVALPAAARHLQLAGPAGPVLVPAERADRLLLVPLTGATAPGSARVGEFPHDAAAAGGRVFVGDERGSTLSVVEGGRVRRTLRTALQPGGVAAVDGGRLVAVISVRERVLELFDAASGRRVGRAPAGVGPTHVVTDGRGHVYVVDTVGGALLVFHLRPKLELTRRLYLPGAPYGVTYDAVRGRIWTTATATNRIMELSAGAYPRRLRSFGAVRQPDSVAVDAATGRVFVTGREDGVLQLLDPPALAGAAAR